MLGSRNRDPTASYFRGPPSSPWVRTVTATDTPQIGIIGLGQFGRFAAAHLAPYLEIVAYDPMVAEESIMGVQLGTLAEAAAREFVLVCVPVLALRDALNAIGPHLQSGACVLDACSVKIAPMRWLEEELPPDTDYVGTHPLFGPRSAGNDLEGHQVVLCPGRGQRVECVAEFLRMLGLYVIVTDAETHDRESARAQVLAQYVGRALVPIDASDTGVTTYAAELLREVEDIVAGDSWELFTAIQTLNPFAAGARAELRASMAELDARLESK